MPEPSDRVRRLERRDDAFRARQQLETVECVDIRRARVRREACVLQVRVLRADARVVEPGGDGVGLDHLPVRVLQEVTQGAVQDARLAQGE